MTALPTWVITTVLSLGVALFGALIGLAVRVGTASQKLEAARSDSAELRAQLAELLATLHAHQVKSATVDGRLDAHAAHLARGDERLDALERHAERQREAGERVTVAVERLKALEQRVADLDGHHDALAEDVVALDKVVARLVPHG